MRTARSGHGGLEVCELLTAALDRAIGDLITPLPDEVAVVALGGYGRGEMSLYSDVDLMLLHSSDDPADLAAALFRPLWDAKLRVGHSVRTLKEASTAAKERFETQTTLLTARLVAGDEEIFDALMAEVTAVTRARPLRRHLVAEESERRRQAPFLLMATDLKTGRGGLRTLHGFEWEERREELIGRFSTDSREVEDRARDTLLRTRNALHAVTGRAHDVFSPELREPAARWLGIDTFDAAANLVDALQHVDQLATQRWPEVISVRPRRVWEKVTGRSSSMGVTGPMTFAGLVTLLETGEQGRVSFERLWDDGELDDVLPEWKMVQTRPQLAPFHEHPVAAHLWRTVAEMRALIDQDGPYGRIARELNAPEVLVVSAFLHDIGKGHGGDHSEIGAEITRSFCERLGVAADQTSLIEGAVRHHLLLPMTATRRDLDDPAVISEVAATVGSLQLLQVLYLLTVADSRATGPSMWSEWKATLVRTLFTRCAGVYGADHAAEMGTSRGTVISASTPNRIPELEAHLDGMPSDYLRSSSVDDVLWHLDLIRGLEGSSAVDTKADGPVETAVIVGRKAPSLHRRVVTEVFAAKGIDVLEARLFGRADGMIVDSYQVRDDRTGGHVEGDKWASVRRDIEAGLLGELDTGSKLAARAAAYDEPHGDKPSVSGSVDAASGDLVVTIKCADRIGRLAEILSVLDGCGLDIKLAKIDGREGTVIDTFHVVGKKSQSPAEIEDLARRIAGEISS